MTPFDVLLIFDGVVLVAAACVIYCLQRQRNAELKMKLQKSKQQDEQSISSSPSSTTTSGCDHQLLKLEMKTLIYQLESKLSTQNLLTWVLVIYCAVMSTILLSQS